MAATMQALVFHGEGVVALKDVSLDLRRGEVHSLLRENGVGKSTVMKIHSGAY